MIGSSVSLVTAKRVLSGLCLLLCAIAAVLHAPGHISYDTSVQLHEAATGINVSWNPPFMSALLRWLGGNALAAFWLMLINVIGAYVCLRAIVQSSLAQLPQARIATWRLVACIVIIANPVIFLYVGILWKDVLIASLMLFALTFAVLASRTTGWRRLALAVGSLLMLLPMPMARQQGIFMLPILLLAPAWLLMPVLGRRFDRSLRFATVALATILATVLLLFVVDRTIRDSEGQDVSNGFQAVMAYDIAAAISRSRSAGQDMMDRLHPSQAAWQMVTELYTPMRSDPLHDPDAMNFLGRIKPETMQQSWLHLLREHPGVWLRARWDAFAWLLDMHDLNACLPVHVGVMGNPDYLHDLDIQQGIDGRGRLLVAFSQVARTSILYRHWFYALLLPFALVAAWRVRIGTPTRVVLMVHLVGLSAYLLSFFPTSLACDFRYLYPLIPSLSAIGLVLLLARGIGDGVHEFVVADEPDAT